MLKSDIAVGTETLTTNGWLKETPPEFAAAILAHCNWRTMEAGTAIQHAGDTSGGLIGIARGTISLTTALGSPDSPMIHIGHPGTWLGFIPLFSAVGRAVSVMARSDVVLARLSQVELERLLWEQPVWWRHVGTLGVIYGNTATNIASDLMIRDSSRRCAASLLRLANCRFQDDDGQRNVEAPLSQDELAALSNLSRTSVSTILHDLVDAGLISLGYRSVILHDTPRLRALVDEV
nr:Crp/Fnr family transcriptional regulator [Polymorphobacter sp.]